jgi:hypothetical protein
MELRAAAFAAASLTFLGGGGLVVYGFSLWESPLTPFALVMIGLLMVAVGLGALVSLAQNTTSSPRIPHGPVSRPASSDGS